VALSAGWLAATGGEITWPSTSGSRMAGASSSGRGISRKLWRRAPVGGVRCSRGQIAGERGGAPLPEVRLLSGRVGPRRADLKAPGRLFCGRLQRPGATREGIVEGAKEDYAVLLRENVGYLASEKHRSA
jgi:hypothetical protein